MYRDHKPPRTLCRLFLIAYFIPLATSFEYSAYCNKMCSYGRGGNLCKCNAVHFVGKRGAWNELGVLALPSGIIKSRRLDNEPVKRSDSQEQKSSGCSLDALRSGECQRRVFDKRQWNARIGRRPEVVQTSKISKRPSRGVNPLNHRNMQRSVSKNLSGRERGKTAWNFIKRKLYINSRNLMKTEATVK